GQPTGDSLICVKSRAVLFGSTRVRDSNLRRSLPRSGSHATPVEEGFAVGVEKRRLNMSRRTHIGAGGPVCWSAIFFIVSAGQWRRRRIETSVQHEPPSSRDT